jgi:hypothetical protein
MWRVDDEGKFSHYWMGRFFLLVLCGPPAVRAAVVEYDLTIARQEFNFTVPSPAGDHHHGAGRFFKHGHGDVVQAAQTDFGMGVMGA